MNWRRLYPYGIKQAYPRLTFLSPKARGFLQNSRPATLGLPLFGGWFLIQASLPAFNISTPNLLVTLLALVSLMLINAAGNNFNSLFDIDIDRVNKPYRPLPSGKLTVKEVQLFSAATFTLAWLLAAAVHTIFLAFVSILILLTVFYSAPPVRAKARLWIGNGFQAFIRGFLGVLAAWSVFGELTTIPLALGITMFAFVFAAQTSKDVADIPGDAKYGVRTLPVVFGIEGALKIVRRLLITPFILILVLIFIGWIPLQGLFLLIMAIPVYFLAREMANIAPSERIENAKSWAVFYATAVLWFVAAAIVL